MNADERSDESVVPTTSANNRATAVSTESIEGGLSALRTTLPSNPLPDTESEQKDDARTQHQKRQRRL
jgi:hypothetical protein